MESVFTESQVTMLKVREKAVFKFTMAELIILYILCVHGYQVKAVSYVQGQEAKLIFPYPCDSTEVTLQHSYRVPFYSSSDGSSLSLPQDHVQRYKVQNRNNMVNCSLEFTISKLLSIDQGTYISLVYKDGEILIEQTNRIWLKVDYPPGKASCVVSEDKGGDWVSIDCIAKVGSLSGKIECYQDGEWMPPLTDPTETGTLLKQTVLIRKSQPAFCCYSTMIEYKDRCECDDTVLYLDDASNSDLCPTISTNTSTASIDRIPDLVEKGQSFNSLNDPLPSNTTSTNSNKITTDHLKSIIIHSIFTTAMVIMITFIAILLYKWRQKRNNKSKNWENEKLNQIQTTLQEFATYKTQNIR